MMMGIGPMRTTPPNLFFIDLLSREILSIGSSSTRSHLNRSAYPKNARKIATIMQTMPKKE
jgi:hypothetical protein